jgi:hypothetical protein
LLGPKCVSALVVWLTHVMSPRLSSQLSIRYRLALRLAKDPRFMRLGSALPKGHYADDDIVQHVTMHRCYIVATCDKDLKRRLRKIPGKLTCIHPAPAELACPCAPLAVSCTSAVWVRRCAHHVHKVAQVHDREDARCQPHRAQSLTARALHELFCCLVMRARPARFVEGGVKNACT